MNEGSFGIQGIGKVNKKGRSIDWLLLGATIPILAAGLVTMNSFQATNGYFTHQLLWVVVALGVFFAVSFVDVRFLKRTEIIITLFSVISLFLIGLFVLGQVSRGSQSWFNFGLFSFQPSDPAKIILVLLLAKYFSRRHIEIANLRHIIVSGFYACILFILILVQPNFGDAIIVFLVWFGMVLVSGISKKHLLALILTGTLAFGCLWGFVFKDYQKARILTFIHPLADIRGAGYNAYQSTIAVGSGQILGKGIGHGTQSKLSYLPEYQTDFIFAAFSEEWGFVGALFLLLLYAIIIWRILAQALKGASNFETFYAVGIALLFMTNFTINVGMNMGLLPVTGVPLPFMSYGGSHLVTEFLALGILMSMRRYAPDVHRAVSGQEMVGIG